MPMASRHVRMVAAVVATFAVAVAIAVLLRGTEPLEGTVPVTRDGIYVTTSEIPYVIEGYATAAKRRDLLVQLPCHCGCMTKKPPHGSSLECFGTAHAETCSICIRTAKYVDRAADQGRTVAEMKRYLDNVFTFEFD